MYESDRVSDQKARKFYSQRRFNTPSPKLRQEQLPRELEPESDVKRFQGRSREEFAAYVEAVHSPEARAAFEKVCLICEVVREAGGRALLVGGSVRDEILGIAAKDFDLEVYGLGPEVVEEIVNRFGQAKDVGHFGVLKMSEADGIEIDISLPRVDSKIGEGHRGFRVKVDPHMSIKEAAKRRDFTFNGLSKDPLTGEIFDPYGGVDDLRARKLRVTNRERFADDPLRLLRAAQFVGRFGLSVELETTLIMRDMVSQLNEISAERFREEWEKLLLKAIRPSAGLMLLNDLGVIDHCYPELAALRGSEQEFVWHPEGDVWVHTLMVVDAAREIVERRKLTGDTARVVMFAGLCHDLGKPLTQETSPEGRIISHAHDVEGEKPTRSFLERIGARKKEIEIVVNLVREHIWPTNMYLQVKRQGLVVGKKGGITEGAFRKLAKRLDPATIEQLACVVEADCLGVGPFLDPENPMQLLMKTVDAYGLEAGRWMRKIAERIGVYREKAVPFVTGKELISLGFVPGKVFGELIALADECRDSAGLEKEEVLRVLTDAKGDAKKAKNELEKKLEK